MPGFVTHYLFGLDAYRQIHSESIRQNLHKNHSAFALGLQGPDIFFFYLPSYLLHGQNMGDLAHREKTQLFYSNLLKSRMLFEGNRRKQAIADAYITGFLGHYTLDCIVHPYVYAFTGYDPQNPPSNSTYFGQHAYLESEIDKELLFMKKGVKPSRFHQSSTVFLTLQQRMVISQMLTYAFRHTYPALLIHPIVISNATRWMRFSIHLMRDTSGQKKVLMRLGEKFLFHRPFISAMIASDHHQFVPDCMNYKHKKWTHPWTNNVSDESFLDLYHRAFALYCHRIHEYYTLLARGFTPKVHAALLHSYGNRSFLSGEEII